MRHPSILFALFMAIASVATAQTDQPQTSNPPSPPANENESSTTGQSLSRQAISNLTEAQAEAEVAKLQEMEAQDRRDALEDFKKGAGLGISIVLGGNQDVIEDAVIVDGKIVVTRRAKDQTRAALEVHQLFTANPFSRTGREQIRKQIEHCAANSINCPLLGIGPFAAIQTGDNNSINSAGLGIMIGVRSDPRKDSSFNVGVGIVFDSRTKELAAGFVEGQAPPTGETQVRFTEESSRRLMITMSFAF